MKSKAFIMKTVDTKSAFYAFKPESAVFVLSVDLNKKPSGMVAGFNMKCSTDPFILGVALWKEGYTHKLIRESKEFVVAVPNLSMKDDIEYFGSHHGDEVNKFEERNIETIASKYIQTPLLAKATINFECKLYKEVEVGDHFLFLGEVLASYIDESKKVLLNMGKKDGRRIFREF